MCAIIESTHIVTPMVGVTSCDFCPYRLTVVHIFAFTVFKLTKYALFYKLSHLSCSRHIAVIFGIEVVLT